MARGLGWQGRRAETWRRRSPWGLGGEVSQGVKACSYAGSPAEGGAGDERGRCPGRGRTGQFTFCGNLTPWPRIPSVQGG